VVADIFAGGRTPAHLTSAEFTAAAANALGPGGLFAVNIGDGPPLIHSRARLAAVRSVFSHVCVIADPGVLRGRRFGNLVAAGSDRELPIAGLVRRAAADPFRGRVVHGAELDKFIAGSKPITDASAETSPAPPRDLFTSGRRSRRTALRLQHALTARVLSRIGDRQMEFERGAIADCAANLDLPLMCLGNRLDDRQAKAEATSRPAAADIDAGEPAEDPLDVGRRNARTRVVHSDHNVVVFTPRAQLDLIGRLGLVNGVLDQGVQRQR
jgi:hypothetical protein